MFQIFKARYIDTLATTLNELTLRESICVNPHACVIYYTKGSVAMEAYLYRK